MPQTKTATEYLKVNLGDAEIMEHSRALAREMQSLERIEDTKTQVVSEIKSQIEAANATCRRLSQLVANGYEFRSVACTWSMDAPEIGRKTLTRDDTGEVVRTERMTDEEKQQELPLVPVEEVAHAVAAAVNAGALGPNVAAANAGRAGSAPPAKPQKKKL